MKRRPPLLMLVWTAAVAAWAFPGWADRLILTNGETVEGVIEEESDERVVLNVGMGAVTFRKSRIERIERESDASNADRQGSWRIEYMQVPDLPKSMQGIARRYEEVVRTRNKAFAERDRMQQLEDRIERLQNLVHRDLERYRDVAKELRGLSKTSGLEQYNELAMEHNELMSRIETNRREIDRARKASVEAVRAMIAYSHTLVHFRAEFAVEEARLRRNADDIGTAWIDRAAAQLARFEEDFVKMEAPTRHEESGTLVSVSINGSAPATFLLDTGASVVTLTGALALRLGLSYDRAKAVPLALADGSETQGYPVMLKSVTVGEARADNVPAVVLDNAPSEGVEGLLGMTFLSRFEMVFDGTTGNLVLRRLKGL